MSIRITKTAIISAAFLVASSWAGLAGELKIVGTGDGLEMLRAVAVAFKAQHPDVKITIPPSVGSGGGIAAVGNDIEKMGRVARPLKKSEVKYGLVYVPIARIPSAFFTHPSTKVTGLKSSDIVKIYTGKAKSWDEFGGSRINVKVVRREEADSTLQVLRATMKGWLELKLTPRSKLAMTTQEAVDTVREVPGTIGFGPYTRPLDFDTNVLKVDGKFPTDKGYPSAVELALIYKKDRLDAEIKAFIDFCFSEEAMNVIKNYGGVPTRR